MEKSTSTADRVEVRIGYELAMFTLNQLHYNPSQSIYSPFNKKVSASRHRIHVAIGEAERLRKLEGDES